MSRLRFVSTKCLSFATQPSFTTVKRTFLSEAYQCREAWEKRLESPILKRVNVQNLYQEIDLNYSNSGQVNAIDADIFINANTRKAFIEDIEDILVKLRRSPDTVNTPPSAHHAALRLLLDTGRTDTLLKILNDRLTYGVFPDHYCANLLMDMFLKQEKYAASARIGVLQMLQEDWENLLTTRLAVYSCHMYLRNSDQPWYLEEEIVPPASEPKEVVKVRVKFIRKPYFDDLFDLKDPMLLVGKTLSMFSSKIGGSDQLTRSYHLLGLTLHQKWDRVMELVDKYAKNRTPLHSDIIQLAKKSLEVKSPAEEPASDESKPSKPTKPDPQKEAKEAALKAEMEMKQKVSESLSGLEHAAIKDDLLAEMSSLVKEAVKLQESTEIEQQKKLYAEWEKERIQKLKVYQEVVRREVTLKRIEKEKAELVEKEREIFFFENEDKLEILIEGKEEILKNTEEKKVTIKESQASKDADYIPPEVFKRHNQ